MVGNDNFGLLLRESFRCVLADSLAAARDHDDFSLQHDLPPKSKSFYDSEYRNPSTDSNRVLLGFM